MMRVRFGELSEAEASQHQRIRARAQEAWGLLQRGLEVDARRVLQQIDARLSLYVDRDRPGEPACVELTALESSAWPLAEMLLRQAPADFGCTLSLGRAGVSLARAISEVQASHAVDLSRATLRAGFARGHLLEVSLGVPGGTACENEQNAAENLVRAALGDRLFETWIGAVYVTAAPRLGSLRVLDAHAPRTELQVQELFDTVVAAVNGVLAGLPELCAPAAPDAAPCVSSASQHNWTMLEVEPLEPRAGRRKDDLVLASTCMPELLRCYLDGLPCSSRRFSRSGETFAFLSYVDEETTLEGRVARRTLIESALAEALQGIGVVTGVGLGVMTTYLDFALLDPEAGLGRVVSRLRDLGAPRSSSVRFFDSELGDEWLSIWPDSLIT